MKKIKKEKFNLIKTLNQKRKDEKINYEGAIIAFRLSDGTTGTWTICDDAGIRLRLIQEGKIQEKILDLELDDMAKRYIMSAMSKPEVERGSYLG